MERVMASSVDMFEGVEGVFDRRHRALSIGIVLGVTLFAFEGLAVVTIAPRFADALGGLALYGWVFSGFLLASLLGTVMGGWQADRHGPGRSFTVGVTLFGVGIVASAVAPTMMVMIVGRVLQGLGGGAFGTAMYVAVNLAYPDRMRPRMMAFMSSAWVVPALLGPALAGLVADTVGWRAVFWGTVPLLLPVALLTVPTFSRLDHSPDDGSGDAGARPPLLPALLLVLGSALFLVGLGVDSVLPAVGMAVAGAALALPALGRLTPPGTLRLARGLPSVIAARGFLYGAFAGVEAFLALMLTTVHGYSSVVAGAAIATGALSWTAGAWLQVRLDERTGGLGRGGRVALGAAVMSIGLALQLVALYTPVATLPPVAVAIAGWMAAGLGIGLAHATSSVLAFAHAPDGQEGEVAAALQLADQFTSALSTGVGGALLVIATGLGVGQRGGVLLAMLFGLALGLACVQAARRIAGAPVAPLRSPAD